MIQPIQPEDWSQDYKKKTPKETPLDLPYSPEEKMLSPQQAAEFIGVSMVTIGRYLNMKNNPLPAYRLSNRIVRIKPEELQGWIDKRKGTFKDYKNSELNIKNYK